MYIYIHIEIYVYMSNIGLTGNALDVDIAYFVGCGANEVLTKPFNLSLTYIHIDCILKLMHIHIYIYIYLYVYIYIHVYI
jgi:hypothetical protein